VTLRAEIARRLALALSRAVDSGSLPAAEAPAPQVEEPRNPEHGDFACSFALIAAKALGLPPRQTAEALAAELKADEAFASVEAAGPGFLNLRLDPAWTARFASAALASAGRSLLQDEEHYARTAPDRPLGINVEFVSVNPNGPITIGSGRGAAYGSTLCNVLAAAGHRVHREYYINDGVNSEQMRLFAESVMALAEGRELPEKGYKGDYVRSVAEELSASAGWELEDWRRASEKAMIAAQREGLGLFGVEFDTWFSEQSLLDQGIVQRCIEELEAKGAADEEPRRTVVKLKKGGAIDSVERQDQAKGDDDADEGPSSTDDSALSPTLWLRSTKFGDDMDRVLRRRDGRLTYISSDVAYHWDKFNRPEEADRLITVLGPDHHGYIGRLQAVVAAMGMSRSPSEGGDAAADLEPLSEHEALIYSSPQDKAACLAATAEAREKLHVQIYQLVRFLKDGKPAPMRKRDGNIYALIDLIREIGEQVRPGASQADKDAAGRDVARFFYLMRHHDTTFDFDLDLAARQSDENPVFYVQYAHARICSVMAKAADSGLHAPAIEDWPELAERLVHEREKALILKALDLPYEIARCAEDYAVSRLATYSIELARSFHHFYDACRVSDPEQPELSRARLGVCLIARTALQGVLEALGVSAPERMDRAESAP
jgi:arginyl-tRNA synthetase